MYNEKYLRYDHVENQIERAELAINNQLIDSKEKEWFTKLLNILKDNKIATVYDKNGKALDVTKIAHTISYMSFFDVYSLRNRMDLEIDPLVIDTKPNSNRTYCRFIKTNKH